MEQDESSRPGPVEPLKPVAERCGPGRALPKPGILSHFYFSHTKSDSSVVVVCVMKEVVNCGQNIQIKRQLLKQ